MQILASGPGDAKSTGRSKNFQCTHGGTRTPNLRFRRPTPYPLGHAGTHGSPCRGQMACILGSRMHDLLKHTETGVQQGCMIMQPDNINLPSPRNKQAVETKFFRKQICVTRESNPGRKNGNLA